MMKRISVAVVLPLCGALRAQVVAPPPDFDSYVKRVLSAFDVPGAAVAIVKDGKVVVARGYGVRSMVTKEPVDSLTRFGIASNTKAFTSSALAVLVERGLLKWDAPVRSYLPDFALYDPFVTREMTVRDLLVHRSGLGLGAGDLLWWPASTYTRSEIVRRLRYIKLATSFRSAYAYDNVLYLVTGELIEKVTGKTWEAFIREELLDPVGMAHSTVSLSDAAASGNVAATHAPVNGKVVPVRPFTNVNTNPAGGINSNAADMARWLITQLDSGRAPDGKRLWSPTSTVQLWTGVTPQPIDPLVPELTPAYMNFRLYALGFEVHDYRGLKVVEHTGGLPGYLSLVLMIPDRRLGVAVLTNQESEPAFRSIGYAAIDHYLGVSPTFDWLAGYTTVADRAARAVATQTTTHIARDTTVHPSLPLPKLAMTYTDAWYGDVVVGFEKDHLTMRFLHTPELRGVLEHQKGNAFIVRWNDPSLRADAIATFQIEVGRVERLKLVPLPGVDFSFDFQDLDLRPLKRVP